MEKTKMSDEDLSLEEFLTFMRKKSTSKSHQGRQFEEAMAALLPQLQDYEFENAWLWHDWPQRDSVTGMNAQDVGIDIVVQLRDQNEFWAVQCKFYDASSTITHSDLGTFFTASGRVGFSGRLIITTTDKWTVHAENMLSGQQIETHRLRLNDLKELPISWNWLTPGKTKVLSRKKELFPRQEEALSNAITHYTTEDRGQLIMACGTGKTFTSLKIAEKLVPPYGSVLFVVPSLSLMKQTITEWAWERTRECRYIGICSDDSVGQQDEPNTHIADIAVPVSTNPRKIGSFLDRPLKPVDMTVVFCTYQSLDRLSAAQKSGKFEFDLIICDEAHRTTGVDRETNAKGSKRNSNFVNVHDQKFIFGSKRLYMTATPRIYTEAAQKKAGELDLGVFSMDDKRVYGPEFFKLGFGTAVSEGLLSDYRVIVLNISEEYISSKIGAMDKNTMADIDTTMGDISKIVGCYKALRDQGDDKNGTMLRRAVSFSNTIKNSKILCEKFESKPPWNEPGN